MFVWKLGGDYPSLLRQFQSTQRRRHRLKLIVLVDVERDLCFWILTQHVIVKFGKIRYDSIIDLHNNIAFL